MNFKFTYTLTCRRRWWKRGCWHMSPSLLSKLFFTRSLCYWNQADSWWGFDMGVKLIVVVDVGRRRDGWKQFVGVRFLLMPHTVIFTTETVATERTLKIAVPRVHHLVTLEVFTGWKPLVTLATLKSFLPGMSFGSLLTRNLHLYKMLWLLLFVTIIPYRHIFYIATKRNISVIFTNFITLGKI